MSVSVAIMAHPKRAHFVTELQNQLPEAEVVWDRENSRWETGRRSLLAFDPDASHHVVVQDDGVLCRNFMAGVERLTERVPDSPISLYTGRTRPFGKPVREAVQRTKMKRLSWLVLDELYWGVGVVLPVPLIQDMIAWHDIANIQIPNYDSKMSWYFRHVGVRTYYPQPSLIDHRDVSENPSLVPGRFARGRVAHRFLGDRDPGDVNWDTRLLYLRGDGRMFVRSFGDELPESSDDRKAAPA
jgi:hypothetical protein